MFEIALICCITATLASLAIILAGIWKVLKSRKSRRWPVTQAIITRFEFQKDAENYEIHRLSYEFSVNGNQFSGMCSELGIDIPSDPIEFEPFAKQLASGSEIAVFYDPTDPSVSVLKPGTSRAGNAQIAAGMALLVISCIFAYQMLQRVG